MNYITAAQAAKMLNLSKQHFLKKCHLGDFTLYKCNCSRSYILDEEEIKSIFYEKHNRSGYDKFNQNKKQES
jgi:hypothetical protein